MIFKSYQEALSFIETRIPRSSEQKFPGGVGLQRAKLLMHLLGNPQDKLKVIHVAGTSGKGSTAYLTALGLSSLGFKVGLHLSPYITDLRERIQIIQNCNNRFISKTDFVKHINTIISAVRKLERNIETRVTYFELLTALVFYSLYKFNVDYAVIEVGIGGTYDATNVVQTKDKIAVITKIGLDHTRVLGRTTQEITRQKAGIIHPGNDVVYVSQDDVINRIIEKRANASQSQIFAVRRKVNYTNIKMSHLSTEFDFVYPGILPKMHVKLGLLGEFQVINTSLALAVIGVLSKKYNFFIDKHKLINALSTASFGGRFEIVHYNGKKLILDGAHNVQKMKAFIKSLTSLFSQRKFVFWIGIKRGKNLQKIIDILLPFAMKVYASKLGKRRILLYFSTDPNKICMEVTKRGTNCVVVTDMEKEFNNFVRSLGKTDIGVITGSLYLVGTIKQILSGSKI